MSDPESEVVRLREAFDALEKRLDAVERFQTWIRALAVGAGVLLTYFADGLKKKFGLG